MRIVLISDTHESHEKLTLPAGDMLIHAGDFTYNGHKDAIVEFNEWLGRQQFKWKFLIAGNHDRIFEEHPKDAEALITNATYLNDSGITVYDPEGLREPLRIWGSPIQPWFYNWAFNRHRGDEIKAHWDLIPRDTNLLITHGPPWGTLDRPHANGSNVGCEQLWLAVQEIKPKLHVFGHIHGSYGIHKRTEGLFVNASSVDEGYKVTHKPVVIEYGLGDDMSVVQETSEEGKA